MIHDYILFTYIHSVYFETHTLFSVVVDWQHPKTPQWHYGRGHECTFWAIYFSVWSQIVLTFEDEHLLSWENDFGTFEFGLRLCFEHFQNMHQFINWSTQCKNSLSDDFGPPFTKPQNHLLSCNVTVAKWIILHSQHIVLVIWIEFPPKLYQVTLVLTRKKIFQNTKKFL